jgi:hypothetical protein
MQDLESSLSVMLRSEIAHMKTIQGEALGALKKWIRLLAMYFPGREPVGNYLTNLKQKLESLVELTSDQWLTLVNVNKVYRICSYCETLFLCKTS